MSILSSIINKKNHPNFLVIGAQKAGTSSMFENLKQHPNVFLAEKKEIHFFDNHYHKGISWYTNELAFSILKNYSAIGEVTPYYLFHPLAPERIKEHYPNIKIITLLRNPIDRAYSHYAMQFQRKAEKRSFEQAIENEMDAIKEEEAKLIDGSIATSLIHQNTSYLSRGLYSNQLRRWFNFFGRDQFHILSSDDFAQNTNKELSKIYNFLEIAAFEGDAQKTFETKYDLPLEEKTRKELSEFFKEYNADLYQLLNRDFGW